MDTAPYTAQLATWSQSFDYSDLPDDVVAATKLRVLDVIGLVLAGHDTAFGVAVRKAAKTLHPVGDAHIFGSGSTTSVTGAAFTNGALSQALEFDDTHNRSVVHMSSPAVAAGLAISESKNVSGRDLITAVAVGNEVSCRVGSIAPQQFHKRGFHPTAMFATFGTTYLSGMLLGLSIPEMSNAAGICGSFASGLLECWVDGTQSKFLHPGWAAQSGITAATLAASGVTGPGSVIEGRWGLINSHLQTPDHPENYEQLTKDLGQYWESRYASFKPYPVAHVIHPYIDALLHLRKTHDIKASDVVDILCPIAGYQVGIVCEPLCEKTDPLSDSHGRVSLQFTLAEALISGRIDRGSYSPSALADPSIRSIARLVRYEVDPAYPGPEQFKGAVRVTLKDGRVLEAVEEHNRGSFANPMSEADVLNKFEDNASDLLDCSQRNRLVESVLNLGDLEDAAEVVRLSIAAPPAPGRQMQQASAVL
jgi:2-methylcitrate dehydratase PrpD